MKKIRLSTGSAAVLDLKKVSTNAESKTIYLMNSGGCEYNCSFCAQAKDATSTQDKLSRVSWPEYESEEVLNALAAKEGDYKRICMQVVNTKDVFAQLPETVRKLRESAPNTKIAMTIRTYQMEDVDAMFAAGANEVGLSIDAIDPAQFAKIKGGNFTHYKNFILNVADKYPHKIATHLIIGMGETEQQAVEIIQELHDHKVIIALFAFTPVRGAKMEFNQAPDISSYRRIQIALHLIRSGHKAKFTYNEDGQIEDFGFSKQELQNLLQDSNVFETSGCSDCNRPYYNERAGSKALYNHPEKIRHEKFLQAFDTVFNYARVQRQAIKTGLPVLQN